MVTWKNEVWSGSGDCCGSFSSLLVEAYTVVVSLMCMSPKHKVESLLESQDPETGWDRRGQAGHTSPPPSPACRQDLLLIALEGWLPTLFIRTSGGQNTTHNQGLPGHRHALQRTICVCLFWLSSLKSHSEGQGRVPNTGSLE